MIERKERKPYWRHTKWQMLTSLLPFLLTLIVLPLYADRLNGYKFLGFPLGFFAAGIPASLGVLFNELYPADVRGAGVVAAHRFGMVNQGDGNG